jgi:RNA polymerase sigma-70 factor (ECF subfamily)
MDSRETRQLSLNRKDIYLELLVLRCQQGDRQALEELVRHFEKRLYYYIHRLVDDEHDVWNILQDTWLKVIRSMGHLRQPNLITVWLYSIARHTIVDYRRGKYAQAVNFGMQELTVDIPENASQPEFDNVGLVHHAMQFLSAPHREVLTLHFLEEMPLEAIAAIMGVSVGTIKSRLFYAKQKLKEIIEREDKP